MSKIKEDLNILINQFSGLNIKENKNILESIDYKSKPNLKFKENIIKDFQHDYWIFDNFDIYYSEIENNKNNFELFIVYGCHDNDNIKIVRIHDKKLIQELKGHRSSVDIVKHFYNNENKKRYLLSADYKKIVIVWDLNNYISIFKIITNYSKYIYSFLIIFEKDYIITSTEGKGTNDYSKIYSLNDGKLISNIEFSNQNETLYLIKWKYNNIYYIIELCYETILIYDLSNQELYTQLKSNKESLYYYSGFISLDNKYLYACTSRGDINIWDIESCNLIYDFKIKNSYLFKIILWNTEITDKTTNTKNIKNQKINNYILVSDKRRKGFICLNITFEREIKNKKEIDSNFEYKINCFYSKGTEAKCIKKVVHPIYGQCLISSGKDQNIDLWINNNIW